MNFVRGLISPTTRRGRAIRTFLQGLLGLLTFSLGLISIPGFADALSGVGLEVQVTTMAAWIGIISYLQNALESLLKNLFERYDGKSEPR